MDAFLRSPQSYAHICCHVKSSTAQCDHWQASRLVECEPIIKKQHTKVLLSSIFFMADSVVSGYLSTACWSSFEGFPALRANSRTGCFTNHSKQPPKRQCPDLSRLQ